eukprot:1260253-Pleurochrysis_carterae.AAC.1
MCPARTFVGATERACNSGANTSVSCPSALFSNAPIPPLNRPTITSRPNAPATTRRAGISVPLARRTVLGEQQVLELEIPVDDAHAVQVLKRQQHL